MVQKLVSQILKELPGEQKLPTVVTFPAWGPTFAMEANQMKQIPEFFGSGCWDEESLKLEQFLRSLFDNCHGKLSEEGCKSILLQKIKKDALYLIDNLKMEYLQADSTITENKPDLVTLEKYYFIGITSLIVKQKLDHIVKTPDVSYQQLSAKIGHLAKIAASGESLENRKAYFDSKCVEVFKSALSPHE